MEAHTGGRSLLVRFFADEAARLEGVGELAAATYLRAYALRCLLPSGATGSIRGFVAGLPDADLALASRLCERVLPDGVRTPLPGDDSRSEELSPFYDALLNGAHTALYAELAYQLGEEQHRRGEGGTALPDDNRLRLGLSELGPLVVVGVPERVERPA
jgi:hypothetical protein